MGAPLFLPLWGKKFGGVVVFLYLCTRLVCFKVNNNNKRVFMKKIFTLLMATMVAACTYAQVNFTDAEGNVYGDGETATISPDPEWGDFLGRGLVMVNTSNDAVSVKMDVNIRQLPEGTHVADCFSGGACTNYKAVGTHSTATKTLAGNGKMSTEIEWFNATELDGVCVIDLTLYVNGKKDKTVTAKFVYGSEDAIKGISAEGKKVAYTLDGKRAGKNSKGVVVLNGKKILK